MAKLSQSLVERFFDSVGTKAQEVYNSSPADLTIDAEIVSIVNIDIGEYKVNYQDNIMSVFSNDPQVVYKTGERVYIIVPQGDMSKKKLIFGRSSYQNNSTFKDLNAVKNFYVDQGPNWAELYGTNTDMEICACPKNEEKILIDPANYYHYGFFRDEIPDSALFDEDENPLRRRYDGIAITKPELEEIDDEIAVWSKSNEYIKIQAQFQTKFSGLHNTGKYALQVSCLQPNPKYVADVEAPDYIEGEEPYKIITYELSFSNFDGVAPYSIIEPSLQKGYFQVPTGGIIGIHSIGLIQDGDLQFDIPLSYNEKGLPQYNPNDKIYSKNNIFVSNVQVCFAKQVNLSDTLYYPYIEAPYGTNLYSAKDGQIGRGSIDLIAHLRYGDVDITDDEHCRIHWFRQKADISESSAAGEIKDEFGKTYFDYGGPGWYPVEMIAEEQQSLTIEDKKLYKVDGNKLTIYLDAVPWKWKYKAVITYSTKEIGDDGYEHIKEIANQYAIQEVIRSDSQYDLELKAVETELPGFYEVVNNKDNIEQRDWFGTWYQKGLDDSYNAISEPFHEGKLNILANPFSSWSMVSVQCYDPYLYMPDRGATFSDAYEIAVLEMQVGSNSQEPFVVDWEGDDHFQYDAQGTWRGEKDNKKYVLTPVIRFSEGNIFNYSIKVTAPDGSILGDRDYYESRNKNGWSNRNSLIKDVWVDRYFGINFSVENKYEKDKALAKNNTFTITIYTDTQEKYEFKKQITFSKDGDQGTNGTEWNVTLRPCKWQAKDKSGLFVEPYPDDEIVPLVVEPYDEEIPDPLNPEEIITYKGYKQNNNYRLFLRPYVSKGGTPLEELDKEQAYFYTCSWDVRAPGSDSLNETSKLSSFLRLYHALRGSSNNVGVAARGKSFNIIAGGPWETGDGEYKIIENESPDSSEITFNLKAGNGAEEIKVNKDEKTYNGLVGHTIYPLSPEKDLWPNIINEVNPYTIEDNECYGAVEVVYFDNAHPFKGTGATLEQTGYRFIVKCTVDICRGNYNYVNHEIETASYSEVVSTLVCYYPVDIFFDEEGLLTDPIKTPPEMMDLGKKIRTNWPTTVKYDAIGYNPEHQDEILNFYFGQYHYDGEKNYLPEVLTPETINTEKIPILQEDGEPAEEYFVKFRPVNHLTKNDGYHGAYRTLAEDKPFLGSEDWFLRNVVLYYNRFGNADINGWDGQGLDTNEEDGTVFGVTFGAGWKGKFTNAFTGVLMGVDKNVLRKDYQENVSGLKYPEEAEKSHPYLTGLFGYQEGIQSFGLLENGTAFFGRADRGGRIIIDGSNATIYGGANGMFTSPSIADPMWNTLRINLVDLTHQKDGGLLTLDPNEDGETISRSDAEKIPTGYCVRNNDGQPARLNFDGNSFGFNANDRDEHMIPEWYAKIWKNAYIQPYGSKPYWMLKNKAFSEQTGSEVVYEIDDLDWWDGQDIDVTDDSDKNNNRRINYFDSSWIEINNDNFISKYPDIPSLPDGYQNYKRFPYLPENGEKIPSIFIKDKDGNIVPNTQYPELAERLEYLRKKREKLSLSSFGPQRASTTPAIEIGQHIPGLRPGLIEWGDYEDLFKTLRIPGNRNFMVTYDGTLWAMNGVFMGNVIGANIAGGRIQASQIGVGPRTKDVITEDEIDTFFGKGSQFYCDWKDLNPPKDGKTDIGIYAPVKSGYAMTLDENGITTFGGELIGGSLDVGHFHVIGSKTIDRLKKLGKWGKDHSEQEELGHLIQTGKSDFMGLTHFYGNIGIAPLIIDGATDKGKSGSLIQVSGFTALGVVLENAKDLNSHQLVYNYSQGNGTASFFSGDIDGKYSRIGNGESVEQSSIFAIDSRGSGDFTDLSGGVNGHFWPLHFHTKITSNAAESYITIMDQFKSKRSDSPGGETGYPNNFEGSNYFRVSRWGLEGQLFYIRNRFQLENSNTEPKPDNKNENDSYRGYLGAVSRAGYGTKSDYAPNQGALGITTWNNNAIILHSDDNFALRNRRSAYFYANTQTAGITQDQTWTEKYGDNDKDANLAIQMTCPVGNTDKSAKNTYGTLQIKSVGSPIGIAVLKPGAGGSECAFGDKTFTSVAARSGGSVEIGGILSLNPYAEKVSSGNANAAGTIDRGKPAVIFAGTSDGKSGIKDGGGVHIFCYPSGTNVLSSDCRSQKFAETFWSEKAISSWANDKNKMTSGTKIEIGISANGAHDEADLTKGIVIDGNSISIKGYGAEAQSGIYARFA